MYIKSELEYSGRMTNAGMMKLRTLRLIEASVLQTNFLFHFVEIKNNDFYFISKWEPFYLEQSLGFKYRYLFKYAANIFVILYLNLFLGK